MTLALLGWQLHVRLSRFAVRIVGPRWRARGPVGPWRSWYAELNSGRARVWLLLERR